VHPSLPVTSVQELVALARSRPGELTYASSGSGSTAHLAGELFKMTMGIELVHIPYKGAAPALNDLLGGHVHAMFGFTASALPYIKARRLRPLAVTSERRLQDLPGLPTMQEAGVKGYEVNVWYGVIAPAGTPREIVTRLNSASAKAASDLTERFAELGAYPLQSTPEQFTAFVRDEIAKWAVVVKRSNAHVD
jgi:tripartite-type tricarboxylate transporter receptor subunit TctC